MADDVLLHKKAFISYASEKEETAIDLVKYLENNNCGCWISFRDVDPGDDYRSEIVKAIKNTAFFVFIYSDEVNTSFDVANELLIARKKGKKRFVLRLDDSEPDGPVEYELGMVQWIDCRKDIDGAFKRIAARAKLF